MKALAEFLERRQLLSSSPIGSLDSITPTGVAVGWAVDRDAPNQSIAIQMYVDNQFVTSAPTNLYRPDVNAAVGVSGNHAFAVQLPAADLDGRTHIVQIYGVDATGDPNALISGSGESYTNAVPIGRHDDVTPGGWVGGWALDPSSPLNSISVNIYVDGNFAGSVLANVPRPDVNQVTGYPGDHGFGWQLPAQFTDGNTHVVRVYAIDSEGGTNTVLANTDQTYFNAPPTGVDEGISSDGDVIGWAYDPTDSTQSIAVHVYVDGTLQAGIAANLSRPDVDQAVQITGNHGFNYQLPASFLDGQPHVVQLWAIDSQGGINTPLKNSGRTFTYAGSINNRDLNATYSVTIQGGAQGSLRLSNVRKFDTVNVQITPLAIAPVDAEDIVVGQFDGGNVYFSTSDFSRRQDFKFVAQEDAETLYIRIDGWDGDEGVVVNAQSFRPDLSVSEPDQLANGDISYGWAVGAVPWYTTHNVTANLYYASGPSINDILDLANPIAVNQLVVGASNISQTFTVNINDIPLSPPHAKYLISVIDHNNDVPDSNPDNNIAVVRLTRFPVEQVPDIMDRYGWTRGETLAREWLSSPARISGSNVDTSLPWNTDTITMDWLLSHPTISNAYQSLIRPSYFLDGPASKALRNLLLPKFHGQTKTIGFGSLTATKADLHSQETQLMNYSAFAHGELDDVTASLNVFNFYLVPHGTATLLPSGAIDIKISAIGVYALDSYNFDNRGGSDQDLGYWNTANSGFSATYLPGYTLIKNSTYQAYRTATGRGGDFLVISDTKITKYATPITATI